MYLKLSIICLLALLSVKGGGAPLTPSVGDESLADEALVLKVSRDVNRAFLTGAPAQHFVSADASLTIFTPSNPYRLDGIEDGRKEFEYGLLTGATRGDVLFQGMQPKVQLYGAVAVVTFFSHVSFNQQGRTKTVYWKITDVLVNRDGSWKVAHLHVSTSGKD